MTDIEHKPVYVPVTDAAEIASAERNNSCDLIAFKRAGQWWAEKPDLERYRAQQRAANSSSEG